MCLIAASQCINLFIFQFIINSICEFRLRSSTLSFLVSPNGLWVVQGLLLQRRHARASIFIRNSMLVCMWFFSCITKFHLWHSELIHYLFKFYISLISDMLQILPFGQLFLIYWFDMTGFKSKLRIIRWCVYWCMFPVV